MKYISLQEIIDDILLIVRNNNISESEDFSRAHIAAWVKHYKQAVEKQKKDEIEEKFRNGIDIEELIDNDVLYVREVGPLELVEPGETDVWPANTKRTKDPISSLFLNSEASLLAVHDKDGENIQITNHIRRFYQNFRRYVCNELSAYFMQDQEDTESGYVYVQGKQDGGELKYIWIKGVYESPEDDEADEDDSSEEDIKIPAWMVPVIKQNIFKNELAFMLNRPSDDSNNATLASIKPHGPQDDEK